jgi:excisionase family DNA binding protein
MGVAECAEYLGTTPGVIYQWVSKRTIPFVKIHSSTRFDILEIDQMIEKGRVAANGKSIQAEAREQSAGPVLDPVR